MCSLRGNATEWETATGNNSIFHRALASTEHFSAEFAAVVIMSRLRADKLTQKCRLSERRAICQFYWNTFIECIFQCALRQLCQRYTVFVFLFFIEEETRATGENRCTFFFFSPFSFLIILWHLFFQPFFVSVESFLSDVPLKPWLFFKAKFFLWPLFSKFLQNFSLLRTLIQVEILSPLIFYFCAFLWLLSLTWAKRDPC